MSDIEQDIPKTPHPRPTWDEYFMDLANAAAKRATCDRGRSGCVIVRDRQLLVTGYVGSPRGLPHCDDVGHLLKKVYHEDGRVTQHCVRTVHAEQNAICQAARRGIALDGLRKSITTAQNPKQCSNKPEYNLIISTMMLKNTRISK